MKKTISLFCMMLCSSLMFAQLKVAENGNVGVGTDPETDEKVTVEATGDYENGLAVYCTSGKQWGPAIFGKAYFSYDRQVGIYGTAITDTPQGTGRAYGVIGAAGNRTNGYNYGVFGTLSGSNNGAGVFGTVGWVAPMILGQYAGFFYGDTYVTGILTAQELTTLSDARHKTNVQQISTTALDKLTTLRPVQYNLLPYSEVMTVASDTGTVAMTATTKELASANKIHYGLVAQEVQKIYPELVHADDEGMLSINYIELIPLLIQSVQELSEQVAALQGTNVRKAAPANDIDDTPLNIAATLHQNNPNPFTESTVIAYDLPLETQSAALYIYDMNGVQLAMYNITSFGSDALTIDGSTFDAGMYLYSLIADGKVIDTKRMILTK